MLEQLQNGAKVVSRLSIHGTTDFLALCERVVTPETRYLVLDLDRTIHYGHNVGELLGFELSAYEAYGERYLEAARTRTDRGRFFFDRSDPLGVLRYIVIALGRWALPGLAYLFYVKIAARSNFLRRRVYKWFGLEPVDEVQNVMRETLLAQLAGVPLETARELVRGIWRRLAPDQVVSAEHVAALRARFPNLKIILSSASPQPVLEVAREQLGVDAVLYTRVEEHDGYLSVPHEIGAREAEPRRISPPSLTLHNAAARKIEVLRQTFADFADPSVEKVGVTDTSYGEDHVWALHFTRVVDVNSPTPFSPLIAAEAAVVEIHSAPIVLTQAEIARRRSGVAEYLDRRRPEAPAEAASFDAAELQAAMARAAEGLRAVVEASKKNWETARARQEALVARTREMMQEIEGTVHEYNRSLGRARREALRSLRKQMRTVRRLRRKLVEAQRPLSGAAFQVTQTLENARKRLLKARRS